MSPHTENEFQPGRASVRQQAWLWGTAALALVIDQITKWRVEATFELGDAYYPIASLREIFRLVHVFNTGAAFGTLQGFGALFTVVAFGVSAYLLYMNYMTPGRYPIFRVTLGLIMGGALGNALDRIRLGHVTDFIHFNFRPLFAGYPALDFQLLNVPVFNWADTFIVTGVIILAVLMWTNRLPEERPAPVTTPPATDRFPPASSDLDAFEPVIRHPIEVDRDRNRWRLARFGGRALLFLSLATTLWLAVMGIAWRAGARRKSNRRKRHTQP